MIAGAAPPTVLPEHIWHHRVHTALGERLYFWRLAFAPVYIRDAALAGVKAALAAREVKSAAVYELLGPFDLLLRVWLPSGCDDAKFGSSLEAELTPHGLAMIEPFSVDYVIRHWAFEGEDGGEPSEPAVKELTMDLDKVRCLEADTLGRQDTERLVSERLVAFPRSRGDSPGIKFAIIVGGNSYGGLDGANGAAADARAVPTLTVSDRKEMAELVRSVVGEATTIDDKSLYAGEGFGHFVIMGRAPNANFHDIHSSLVAQLGAAPLRERFRVSTVTLVSGQAGLSLFEESLVDCNFVPKTPSAGIESPENLEDLRPGTELAGRFEVVESLGRGGYGVVYHVRDLRERKVDRALKLFPEASSEEALRELTMLRKVRSPYVVEMIWGDRDLATGWWYLVSEFVEGHTLETYIRGSKAGSLTDAKGIDIIRQVLLGLQAVHPDDERMNELSRLSRKRDLSNAEWEEFLELQDSGVIHRDVTPANIMVTGRFAKLIDFNIASAAGDEVQTNARTPRYAPPGGWSDRFWLPRVDLFATGVILYELLCGGEHPYRYPERSPELVDPSVHRPDLGEAQLAVLRRACSIGDCFERAVEMREAIELAWGVEQGEQG
jgi:hypothetical protein